MGMMMRRDHSEDHYTIIAKKEAPPADPKKSPYAPGNESMTNLSVLSLISRDGMLQRMQDSEDERITGWDVRVFETKTPIVTTDDDNTYADGPFYREPAYGYHYIAVASPKPKDTLASISVDQWSNLLVVAQDRLRWLYTQKRVTYVAIYANHGAQAGSINPHPHMHIATFANIPPKIEAKARASARILNENGVCPACQAIEEDDSRSRQILQTEGFVAVCPWAPSYPYEFSIYPKKHSTSFARITQKDIGDLSMMMRATLGGLGKALGSPDYNIVFCLSPEKKNSKQIHWHISVYPIISPESGLERGFGIFHSDVSPEDAATKLGERCRKELASLVGIS